MSAPVEESALDREELRAAVRDVLERESGPERVRAVFDEPAGHDRALWATMGQLGWPGLAVPERYGGAGASFEDLGVLLGELGRDLTPSPLPWTAVLGGGALLACESEALREEVLPRLASGEVVVTAALTGESGRCEPEEIGLRLREEAGALRVDGVADFVPHAHAADLVVLAARTASGEVALLLADADDAALRIEPRRTWDLTRRLCRLEARDLSLPPTRLLAGPERGAALREQLIDAMAVALACDGVGGAERVLEMTVAHARQRVQFDRPIGSFQAVKHRCADMMTLVETSRVGTEHAAEALARGAADARRAASEAKFYACDSYARVAGDGIQLHGGVGFTWEYDCHLFLKRAKLDQALFGDSAWHRDRAAALLLDAP